MAKGTRWRLLLDTAAAPPYDVYPDLDGPPAAAVSPADAVVPLDVLLRGRVSSRHTACAVSGWWVRFTVGITLRVTKSLTWSVRTAM